MVKDVGRATVKFRFSYHHLSQGETWSSGDSVRRKLFTPQDWYFDSMTGLPLRVEFQIPTSENANDSLPASMDFSNFQTVTGVLVPFQLRITEGPVILVSTVTSATFNTNSRDQPARSIRRWRLPPRHFQTSCIRDWRRCVGGNISPQFPWASASQTIV